MSINDVIELFHSKFSDKEVYGIYKYGPELLVILKNKNDVRDRNDNMYTVNIKRQIRAFTPMQDIDKYEKFLENQVY